ncbi:hypothetical protein [Niameybacter massiliensis]|uniref:hypothetical protein n=1 Tax=Niameybacter massiliensis TaxID=1658108 RepID=UPI0006B5E388|nr:hypothetical protein [Niameybacter massiliensis]
MKQTNLQFKLGIQKSVRILDTRFVFYNGQDKYVLTSEDIQSFTYNSACEKHLGAIEKKILIGKLLKNNKTKNIQEGTMLYKEIWVKYENNWYSDFQEPFIVTEKKELQESGLYSFEAVDTLTPIRESAMPFVSHFKNVPLNSYYKEVLSKLSPIYSYSDRLLNPNLKFAFLKSTDTHECLLELCIASQALLKSDFNLVPFVFGPICDRLTYETGLTSYTIDTGSTEIYQKVYTSLFSPTESDIQNLGHVQKTLPAYASQVSLGEVSFQDASIVQLIKFDNRVTIADYTLGSDKCIVKVGHNESDILNLKTTFNGVKLNALQTVDSEEETKKTLTISNIYMQSPIAYNKSIFKGIPISIKYTGNSLYEVGDTIEVDGKYKVLLLESELNFEGSLRGTLKGVVLND